MERLKVLVVTNDFPPRFGGIEAYVGQLVRHLSLDVSTTILTSRHTNALSFDQSFPAEVIRWGPYPLIPTPRLAQTVIDYINHRRVKVVVFGATLPLALIAGSIRARTDARIVMLTHGLEPAVASVPGGPSLLRRILRHATIVTVLSQWSEKRIRDVTGSRARIDLLRSGIDPGVFHPAIDGSPIRERFALGPGPIIVTVSRLVARKGHDRLIAALPSVAQEFPTVRLLIVGSGPERSRLEQFAARRAVSRHVVFAGAIADRDLPACFAAGDVFAMPCRSRWGGLDTEGLGTVFLEAAAVGCPSVAGNVGGAPEAVIDGQTGLVVDGTKDGAIAAALMRLLRTPSEARAFGAAGAARVHRDLTWSSLARRLEYLLFEAGAQSQVVAT